MQRKTHTIDASGKPLGRLAVEIARLLQGKHKPNYLAYQDMGDFVEVYNIKEMNFTGKKMENKIYYRHSGYPGGLRSRPLKKEWELNPERVLQKAVLGMLPKNKLRSRRIKRLKILKTKS